MTQGQYIESSNLPYCFELGLSARPFGLIERNSLHEGLKALALSLGVEMNLRNAVTSLDPETGSITLEDGTKVTGDVVIGADGIHVC